jgi:GNAT superfamily N-acetyltransferase
MDLCIARARPQEAAELTPIPIASKRHWGYPEAWIDLWRDDLAITPAKIRAREYWVGRLATVIVFIYSIRPITPAEYELEDCWVAPAYIGQGYGTILFNHLRDRLRELGCSKLKIVSDPYAQGFYQRMGAVQVGEEPSKPEGRMLPVLQYIVES